MKVRISVVIPAYNASKFILDCLDSVCRQTCRPFEVIVVSDGSTDNTEHLVAKYFPEVILLVQNNGGVSSARNTGIKISQGDYIAFLDADDMWIPQKLEQQVACIEAYPSAQFFISDESLVYEESYVKSSMSNCSFFEQLPKEVAPLAKPVSWLMKESFVSTSSVLVSSELVNRVGLFQEGLHIGEDRDYWIRLALNSDIIYVPESLVIKRQDHGGNLSALPENGWADGLYRVILSHDNKAVRNKIQSEGEVPDQLFGNNYLKFGRVFYYNNTFVAARKSLVKAFRNEKYSAVMLLILTMFPKKVIFFFQSSKKSIEKCIGQIARKH
jgi:glycosyltransferase involved in cell wall biosynthesis